MDEKLKMIPGEGSNKSHEFPLLNDTSSTQDALKDFSYNDEPGPNFIDDADKAFVVLLKVFRYLSRKDLCSAARVCKVWNLVGSDSIFWKEISLNNCVVDDFKLMAQTLKKYGTEILDLRGVRFCMSEKGGDEWSNFVGRLRNIINLPSKWSSLCETLTEVTSLTQVTLDECPKEAVTLFAKGAPQLKSLSAYRIDKHCDPFWIHYNLDINFLKNMNNLITLILKNYKQQTLVFDVSSSNTTDETKLNLRALTITRAINLSCIEHILPSSLVSLELGEFHSLSSDFCQVVLPKLVNLNRLRLELCHDHDLTHLLVEKVSKLPRLSELELINFSIGNGFGSALGNCTNLKSLLIIPMYKIIAQNLHPIVNTSILHGVSKLKNSLQLFVWVVTEQIISIEYVHRLRINQRRPKVRVMGRGDSIPFIFPGGGYDIDFISLDNAQSFLFQDLNFKIFKTHFSSTWQHSIHNIKR